MKRGPLIIMLVAAMTFLPSLPADAHHSWQLDHSKLLNLSGTVSRFDYANPHVQIYIQIKTEAGSVETWQAGGPSPNQLARGGWSKESIKPGDQVTVAGYQNKDGSKVMRFDTVTLPGGQVISGYRRGYRGR